MADSVSFFAAEILLLTDAARTAGKKSRGACTPALSVCSFLNPSLHAMSLAKAGPNCLEGFWSQVRSSSSKEAAQRPAEANSGKAAGPSFFFALCVLRLYKMDTLRFGRIKNRTSWILKAGICFL